MGFDGRYEVRPDALPPNATSDERVAAVREVVAFLEAAAREQAHGNSALFLAELHLEGVPGALLATLTLRRPNPNPRANLRAP